MRKYRFHTIHEGNMHPVTIEATSVKEAVWVLRLALYDGETIVGW